jgi:hypothetical protein
MLIVKRLLIWFIETCSEVLLLGLAVLAMVGYDKGAFAKDLAGSMSAFVLLSLTTGYLFTTVVARVAWRSRKLWSYSLVATILFLVHSQIFFLVSGADRHDLRNLSVELAGCCVVFACTIAGTFALRKWAPARSELAAPQP